MRTRARFASRTAIAVFLGVGLAVLRLGWFASGSGCRTPSSTVDGGDLMGVFDRTANDGGGIVAIGSTSATASASAKGKRDAGPAPIVSAERLPDGPQCVTVEGEPADVPVRVVGRPACRGTDVLEWRDRDGAPRYACTIVPSDAEKRGPLPLVVFFHGETPGLDDPASLTKLTDLREAGSKFDFGRGPGHEGFILLAVQGRAIGHGKLGGATFDAAYVASDNVDVAATDHFIDQVVSHNAIDKTRLYAVGSGRGGEMAATYAMLRADRVAAFGMFAGPPPSASWSCPGPPPPAVVLYRACDSVAACEDIESWVLAREKSRAETLAIRLGEANEAEPNCAVDKCSKKRGDMNHARWPKAREKDLLRFLAAHTLAAEP